MSSEADLQAVRQVLQQFQDGYTRRDPGLLEDFQGLCISDPELEVIGTGAVAPGDEEWCVGPEPAAELFRSDWEGWGDLTLDLVDARIHILGDVAWLATTGVVVMDLEPEETYQDYLNYILQIAEEEDLSPRKRLLEILRGGTNTLFEVERGERYVWPIRFTAVLVRREENWFFHQMSFSFATTRFPDVRNV
jgi:hypothetical protein